MKPEQSITERFETLLEDHLSDRDIHRLRDAAREAGAGMGLGEWPVALSDALWSDTFGLWVLTTERSLWFGERTGTEQLELKWQDVDCVRVQTGPQGHSLVLGRRDDDDVVHADVGGAVWAGHLLWAVRRLAALDGEPMSYCPVCLIGSHDGEGQECVLCSVPLVDLPGRDLGMGPVAARLRRQVVPGLLTQLAPAVRAAESTLTADDWLWIVTNATLGDEPVLVAANEWWIRAWDTTGQMAIDRLHDDVTVVAGERLGPASDVEVLDIKTRQRTALDNVGPDTWADDLVSRLETDPDHDPSLDLGASSLGPVLGDDGITRCPLCAEEIQPAARICRFCRTDFRELPPALTGSGPRFISDASVGGITVRRIFDAACYAAAGIALIVIGADTNSAWGAVLGITGILYGAKIALTDSSYWVSTGVYLVAFFAVVATFGFLGS